MTAKLTPTKKPAPVSSGAPAKSAKKIKKPKKPLSRFMLVVISFLVFLLMLAGAGYCLYANVGGIAEKALVLLPQYKVSLANLDKQKNDLAAQQAKVQAAADNATADAKANAAAAADIRNQQAQLQSDQQALQAGQQQAQSAADKQQALANIYANLDPAVAAAMLMKAPSLQDAAGILKLLPQDATASILAAVEAQDAKMAYDLAKLIDQ